MKKSIYLLLAFISLFFGHIQAQTVIFQEGFEGTPAVTSGGTPAWASNTALFKSGIKSYAAQTLIAADSTALTTNSFSTTGHSFVVLEFSHICKIEFYDAGEVYVSPDNGTTWVQLTEVHYLGTGGFSASTGNKFTATTYSAWVPGNPSPPSNSWWQTELFDISAIASNVSQVKVRFMMRDMNNQTLFENWGWAIDDIKVTGAVSELTPPTITMVAPILMDTAFNTGPYDIFATMTDASGVATARVIWDLNGGAKDTLLMVNTTGNTYLATIPSFTYGNTINYYVQGIDSTVSANLAQSQTYSFYIKKSLGSGNNLALTATAAHSGGGATTYGAQNYNDDVISATPSALPWGWVTTSGWIEYTWVNPVTFNKVKFWKADRPMNSCVVQIWDGTTYTNIHNYSGSTPEDSIIFPSPYTTTKLRFNTVAGSSNPNHREIQVFAPMSTVPLDYDAGVSHFLEPAATVYTTSSIPVKVRIKNFSVDTLTKVTVGWSINNVVQTPYLWTGMLLEDQVSSILTIANNAFPVGQHVIKVWTSMPNDSLDQNLLNDTIIRSVLVCAGQLSGTYTIGPVGDYATPQGALSALLQCGIAGPVVFNIATGIYPGQLTIPSIPGTSPVNTVTFQSANGDSLSVVITHAASTDNWTVRLNGAQYVKFHKLTLEATGTAAGRVVELIGGAKYNEVSNCNILMPVTTSSAYAGFYCYTAASDNYNIIRNNRIQNGYYGIYFYGTSTLKKIGNIIEGNTIENHYYYGIYLYYHDSVLVQNNKVLALMAPTTQYGMYLYYLNNGCKVLKNTIRISTGASTAYGIYSVSGTYGLQIGENDIEVINQSTNYGIYASGNDFGFKVFKNKVRTESTSTAYTVYLTSCDGVAGDSIMVANNMITHDGGTSNTVYALYLATNTYLNVFNNSVRVQGGSSSAGRCIYQTAGSAQSYMNNNLANLSGGYVFYVATPAAIGAMDYNNYFSTSSNLGYWNANQTTLAAWKTASGKDANAKSVDPAFLGSNDLHVNNPSLNAAGTPLVSITEDIDGDLRNATTPDIGADEFILIANDAGVLSMVSPAFACPGDTSDVIIKIRNYGVDTLKNVTLNWSVNGVMQTSVLNTDTVLFTQTRDVMVGTYNFITGIPYELKFWTSLPNGLADGNANNDTLLVQNFRTAMAAGTYTIGGTGADFATFTDAVTQLNAGGVCGPVVFNVASGTYNEQISINAIAGSSAINTITFQSAAGDSTAVVLTGNATSGNYVVRLMGTSYVQFSKMSIVATSATSGYGVVLTNGASYNEFSNCIIQSPVTSSSSCAPVYSTSGAVLEQFNVIRNNRLMNGYYGVYLYGSTSTVLEKGNVIDGNVISGYYYYGVYGYYCDSLQIRNNIFVNASSSGTAYGMYLYYNDYAVVEGNSVTVGGTSTNYGIYAYYGDYSSYTRNNIQLTGTTTSYGIYMSYANSSSVGSNITLFANNFISQTGANSGSVYGIYSYYSNYVNYYHNSVNVTQVTTAANAYSFYLTSGSSTNIVNNIFSNAAGGHAYYVATTTAIMSTDYNNFFSTGSSLAYWTSTHASLSSLQAASSKDVHSVSGTPKFYSATNLHIKNNININDQGTPIASVAVDIDGDVRNTTTPDIGADEFTPPANEVEIVGLYTYGKLSKQISLPHQVVAVIENSGSSDRLNYPVTMDITGANTLNNVIYFDTLKTGEKRTVLFPALPAGMNNGVQTVMVTLPADDDTTNNVRTYRQEVTDTTVTYADTSAIASNQGFNTAAGLLMVKYPVNGLKSISRIRAKVVGASTVGKTLYGVVVTKSGTILATTPQKVIAAGDINTMVEFPVTNVSSATISNDTVLVGIAQVANATGYYPLGCQAEVPVRPGAFYSSGINGGALTEYTQSGRLVIEFDVTDPPTKDIVAVEMQSPLSGCALGNETVKLKIKNLGSDTIQGGLNTLTVGYRLAGTPVVVTEIVSSTILPGADYIHTFANTLAMAAPLVDSTYNFYGFATLTGDPYQQNDTTALHQVESKQTPLPPVVTSPVNIQYGAQATLTAQSPMPVEWYATDTSTVKLDTGYTFVTPPLFDTTTFWAQAGSALGAPTSLYTGVQSSNYAAAQTRGYHFTAPVDMIITQLMVPNTVTAGNQYIQVVKFNGYPLVYPSGSTFTTLASIANVPFNVPQTVNIVIHAGDEIGIIGATNSTGTTMNNSYGSAQVASSINGIPVVLTRLVYQSPLVSGPAASTSIGLEVSAAIARIDVTYVVGGLGCPSIRVPVVVNTALPPPVDAGMHSVLSPGSSVTSNTPTPVEVTVRNFGLNNLTSVQINYSVNGVLKTPYALTGINLPHNGVSSPVIIGTETYPGGVHTIKVWTSLPNGVADTVNTNDTILHLFNSCLNGTYTVGSPTSDFPTLADAVSALTNPGICGHVVFNIVSGTYNTQLLFNATPGMGPNSTVTFQSASGDSTDVTLQYSATSTTDNYVIRLNGASYFRFRKMTISASISGTYSRGIELLAGSNYNAIENCRMISSAVSSSTSSPVYIYTGCEYNQVLNNNLQGGYYGAYIYGSSSTALSRGNQIIGNRITGFYLYGIYAYYQDSVIIHKNFVSTGINTYAYGLYSYYGYRSEIMGNDIQMTNASYSYGIYAAYFNASQGKVSLMANNFISLLNGTGTSYGIYISSCTEVRVVFNSVHIADASTTSRGFYQSGGAAQKFLNNNIVMTGGGFTTYIGTTAGIDSTDYNNLFTTGSVFAYWGANVATLAALKTASGKETNSISINPNFPSVTNLHTSEISLNGAGKALGYVTTDIDGQLRSLTTPDIGADEFDPPANDAGLVAISGPTSPVTSGLNPVVVTLKNGGLNNLTSAQVNWQVNGILQAPYSWTGNLATNATQSNVTIGSYTFVAGSYDIKAWTSIPNGQPDGFAYNDTLTKNVIACVTLLKGVYTIGGTGADYSSFGAAVNAIGSCGVDSVVIFNVAPGTYNEQVIIGVVPGASASNTVTFQSVNGDSTSVILTYGQANGNNPGTVNLSGTSYVTFKSMTIAATGSSTAYGMNMMNGAHHNTVTHCVVTSSVLSATTGRSVNISGGNNSNFNTVSFNNVQGGYYGIYIYGTSTTSWAKGNVIQGNKVTGTYLYPINAYYNDSIQIIDNHVYNIGYDYSYGINCYYINNAYRITGNKVEIVTVSGSASYGIRDYYGNYYSYNASPSGYGIVANNFISIDGGTGTNYGLYAYYSSGTEYLYNSVNITGTGTSGRALYQYNTTSNTVAQKFLNNVFVNTGGGFTAYYGTVGMVGLCNNNNYYGTGATLAYWGANMSNLVALQAASGKDVNSISVDPMFVSATNLHCMSPALNAAGTPVAGITVDIDGEPRHATTPDIGADEFSPNANDIGIMGMLQPSMPYGPAGIPMTMEMQFRNFGANTVTTLVLGYIIDNGTPVTETWTGSLAPNGVGTHSFANPVNMAMGGHVLKVFTALSGDMDLTNDTLVMNEMMMPIVSPGYNDQFDQAQSYWAPIGSLWQRGVPTGTVINSAHSSPNVWATNLSGQYPNNSNEFLVSPYFDFSNLGATDTASVEFWHWLDVQANTDYCQVQFSTDTGQTWANLGFYQDPYGTNWYNYTSGGLHYFSAANTNWQHSKYKLLPTTFNQNNLVQFRFRFYSNASINNFDGWAIDDFKVALPQVPNDVGITAINYPLNDTAMGSQVNAKVTITNFGSNIQTMFPVVLKLNGITISTETWTGTLPALGTATYTFVLPFTVPSTAYQLCASTQLTGDAFPSNDETCVNFNPLPAYHDVGVSRIIAPLPDANGQICFYHQQGQPWYQYDVVVRIINYGQNTQTSVPVNYVFTTGGTSHTDTWTGSLLPTDSVDITLNTQFLPALGAQQMCVETNLPGDPVSTNNKACKSYTGVACIGIDDRGGEGFVLEQNVPNPASGITLIGYKVPTAGEVVFGLVSPLGQVLLQQTTTVQAGANQIELDVTSLAQGVYYYYVEFNGQRITKKLVIRN